MTPILHRKPAGRWLFLWSALFAAPLPATAADAARFLVIRYDDYSPISPYDRGPHGIEIERRLFDLIARHDARITAGVIPFPVSGPDAPIHDPATLAPADSWLARADDPWVSLLREYVRRGVVEPALHGFEHRRRSLPGYRPGEYRRQPQTWQRQTLELGLRALADSVHKPVRVFVPPWNAWDELTARSLVELGVEWLSPDLHHAESGNAPIRIVPQNTADPAEALAWARDPKASPPATVIVLVTHPFDFYGPTADQYWVALERLLAFVRESPVWKSVGFEHLPNDPVDAWNRRFQAAVRWERTRALLTDMPGCSAILDLSPAPYWPLDVFHAETGPRQWILIAALTATAILAAAIVLTLARLVRRDSAVLRLAAVASVILTIFLAAGAIQIASRDYAVRGIRWQAVVAAAGFTFSFAAAAVSPRRKTRHNPDPMTQTRQSAPDSNATFHGKSDPARANPHLAQDRAIDRGIVAFWNRLLNRGSCAWPVFRTRLLWGRRLHSLGARTILAKPLMVPNPRAVAIGSRVTICSEFILADLEPAKGGYPKIVIGDGTTILFRFQCNAARSVVIGSNVLFASNVLVTDSDHVVRPGGTPVTRNGELITRPVRIEDNCWIGQNAVILKGVTIGHDSIVGANAVVTRDVPPCSVVVGNPARIVKTLEPQPADRSTPRSPNLDRPELDSWKP